MNNNKLIQIYESALDFEKETNNNDFQNINTNFVEKNINPLSETKEPELFHCILKMMNDYPDKYSHENNNYLTWNELNQITILSHNKNVYSYFENFNPVDGNFSIIFKYLKHITNINNYCFSFCDNLKEITIPDSITKIGDCCFSYCENLTEINIPESVTEIGNYCFSHCENLIKINISNSVTEIGNFCFSFCRKLTEIIIPKRFGKNINNIFSSINLTNIKITYI